MVSKAIRDASVAADKKLSAFEVDLGMKKEVRPVLLQVFPPLTRFISFELQGNCANSRYYNIVIMVCRKVSSVIFFMLKCSKITVCFGQDQKEGLYQCKWLFLRYSSISLLGAALGM